MAKAKKHKASQNRAAAAPRSKLARRLKLLFALTALPAGLLFVLVYLVLNADTDSRWVWALGSFGYIWLGYFSQQVLQPGWGELVGCWANYLVLLLLSSVAALRTFSLQLALALIGVFSMFYLLVVAGILLRRWALGISVQHGKKGGGKRG